MKVQCLDREGSPQNCFLLKLRQLTILVNCPLQISSIFPSDQERNEQLNDAQSQVTDFANVLSSYIERRKMLMEDTVDQSGSVNEATCIFRIPDLSLVDVQAIDCVLLTTSKHMLGLPFLTEYLGYKGRILATECAIEFAR
jgi:integrator complex subunit 9